MTQIADDERVFCLVEASEILVLRMLLRQAVPMLKRPEDYGKDRRRALADMLVLALNGQDAALDEE